MGNPHRSSKHGSRRKTARKRSPFPFLKLSPEIRTLIYQQYFGSINVVVDTRRPSTNIVSQFSQLPAEVAEPARDTTLDYGSDDDDFRPYNEFNDDLLQPDYPDRILTFTSDKGRDSELSKLAGNNWRRASPPERKQVYSASTARARLGELLLICRKVYEEARRTFAAAIHLKVLDCELDIPQLPEVAVRLFLPKIQCVTLSAHHVSLSRYGHTFNVRQLPNLRTLLVTEPPQQHKSYIFADIDPDKLVAFTQGEKDDMFIQDWFNKEADVTRWEETFIRKQKDEEVQSLLRAKNAALYWVRSLMFHPEERKFCIHYRRHLTLVMQTLGQATNKKPRLARYSNMEGNVRTQRRVFLDLDFDIDTRKVVRRHIQGRGGVDLSNKVDLKCWILSQFPEEIKELACNLNGGYSASDDSDIEDLIAEFGDEEDLVWRDARYGAEGRGRTHEFGFFTKNDEDSEYDSDNPDNDIW